MQIPYRRGDSVSTDDITAAESIARDYLDENFFSQRI